MLFNKITFVVEGVENLGNLNFEILLYSWAENQEQKAVFISAKLWNSLAYMN